MGGHEKWHPADGCSLVSSGVLGQREQERHPPAPHTHCVGWYLCSLAPPKLTQVWGLGKPLVPNLALTFLLTLYLTVLSAAHPIFVRPGVQFSGRDGTISQLSR